MFHSVYSEDEGRELCRKRGSEFKLPYPIIDMNGCDALQTSSLNVISSTDDDKSQQPPVRPAAPAAKKSSAPRNGRKRKKDGNSLMGFYAAGDEVKSCSELVQQFQTGIAADPYRANAYHDMMTACGDYGRIQPMLVGCTGDYDDEDMIKMMHDVNDSRCYYGNGITSSAAGAGAWYWPPDNAQLASYLYDQQQYLADYSVYRRLVTSPPASLSNGYEALPVTTAGAFYEALTPPDDNDGCLHSVATTTVFPPRAQRVDDDEVIGSSCRRNDNTDRFAASSNNITLSAGITSGVGGAGHGGYGVATPVIQMTAKSQRYILITFFIFLTLHSSLSVFQSAFLPHIACMYLLNVSK